MHAWQACDGGGEERENKGAWQHDGRQRPQEAGAFENCTVEFAL